MPQKVLGIDIGGSGVKGAIVNMETGALDGERHRIETPQPATSAAVVSTTADIVKHFNWNAPIGVGFPGVVKNGKVLTAANLDSSWVGQNADKLFTSKTKCKASVINDADAAGMAEMRFGAGAGQSGVVVMITLGTGIGTALFFKGALLPNTELGHLVLRGKEAEKRASDHARTEHDWSWKKWAKHVNEYLNELDRLLWPDLFIIGGGASKDWHKFAPRLESRVNVVPAKLGNPAGIIGAAMIADTK